MHIKDEAQNNGVLMHWDECLLDNFLVTPFQIHLKSDIRPVLTHLQNTFPHLYPENIP